MIRAVFFAHTHTNTHRERERQREIRRGLDDRFAAAEQCILDAREDGKRGFRRGKRETWTGDVVFYLGEIDDMTQIGIRLHRTKKWNETRGSKPVFIGG